MANLDLTTIGVLVGVAALLYYVIVPKVATVKDKVEHRRERAVELASWSEVNGLPLFKDLFMKYAVGDYTGVYGAIDHLHSTLSNNESAKASVDLFLKTQFNKALETAEGREQLIGLVETKFGIAIDRGQIATLNQVKQPLVEKEAK